MTDAVQNPIDCTRRDQNDWYLYSLEVEAKLETVDREAGHEYVPMDVFVDPWTIKEHFQESSVHTRWSRTQKIVA